MTFYKSYSYD